jgi:hypothetical protein
MYWGWQLREEQTSNVYAQAKSVGGDCRAAASILFRQRNIVLLQSRTRLPQ